MIRYLGTALRTELRRNALLVALTVLAVAIGVAAVVAIQLIRRSAVSTFAAGLTLVTGDVDLSIEKNGGALDERLYLEVLRDPAVRRAFPVLEESVRASAASAPVATLWIDVIGTDLLAASALPLFEAELDPAAIAGGAAWIGAGVASRLGIGAGDELVLAIGSRDVSGAAGGVGARVPVAGVLDPRRKKLLASDRVAVLDVATAQHLFRRRGELDRIDLVLADGSAVDEVAARLATRLGPGIRAVSPSQREQQADTLLAAFSLNLTALSVVSLLVALILIFAATQAALLRRRAEFGLLRSVGATRGQVVLLILAEVALVALCGVALGWPLGVATAERSLAAVSTMLTNIYLLDEVRRLDVPAWMLPLAALIGIGGALAGALFPALDLAASSPRELLSPQVIERDTRKRARTFLAAGVALPALAFAAWSLGLDAWKPMGFVLGFALVAALPLVTPAALRFAVRRLHPRGFGTLFAVRCLENRLAAASVASAALAVAFAMLVGVTLLVGSFRDTVGAWVDAAIGADVYVGSLSQRGRRPAATLDAATLALLAAQPGTRAVDRLRRTRVWIDPWRFTVDGVDLDLAEPEAAGRFPLIDGDPDAVAARMRRGGAALLGEPMARKLGLRAGSTLELPGRDGTSRFEVAGIFYDYTSEFGKAVLALDDFARTFGPGDPTAAALYLAPGSDPDAVIDRLRSALPDKPLSLVSNAQVRRAVLDIFDQTFAVTRILQAMGMAIAAIGIALSLLILGRERAAELALFRSLGAQRPQLFLHMIGQGIGMGAMGLLLGLLGGLGLAWVLIHAINLVYFGWTIQVHWPLAELGRQALLIALAIAAASVVPALRASATPARELSRERV